MTVIFAATYDGGVVIGSDSRAHNHVNHAPAEDRIKVHRINAKVYAAKAGYGPEADVIWDAIQAVPDVETMGPAEISLHLRKLVPPIYVQCLQKAKDLGVSDPGIYILVAGLDGSGASHVHYLNFKSKEFLELPCSAFGPTNTHALANNLLAQEDQDDLDFASWATKLVDQCIPFAPHSVGYPVHLYSIEAAGVVHEIISESGEAPIPA